MGGRAAILNSLELGPIPMAFSSAFRAIWRRLFHLRSVVGWQTGNAVVDVAKLVGRETL